MAVSVKLDSSDIPSLMQILGLGGLSRQAEETGDDFAASGGVATHPPDISDSGTGSDAPQSLMNVLAGRPSYNPPPVDSIGGADNPTDQPASSGDSKLTNLRKVLAGQSEPDVPAPPLTLPGQGSQIPPADLSQSLADNQADINPTFVEAHPKLAKAINLLSEFVQDAAPGVGSRTFGQGAEISLSQPALRAQRTLANTKTAADIANTQSETRLHGVQADQAGQIVTIQTPQGPVTGPLSMLKATFPAMFAAQSRGAVAMINANSRQEIAQLKSQIDAGKIKAIKPAVDDNGNAVLAAYGNDGELIKYLPRSIGPAWMLPTVRSSVDVKEDGNGGFIYIPKTSTTRRVLPPQDQPAGTQQGGSPSQGNTAPQSSAQRTVGASTQINSAQPVNTAQVRQVVSPGGQAGGKISKDAGYAYDPQSGNTVLTTRLVAGQTGLQDFRKAPQRQIDDDRQLTNRLSDVETKLNRYADAMSNTDLSQADQDRLAYLLNSDKFKLGAFGVQVPVDEVNAFMRQHQLGSFDNPAAGYKAFASYLNARESMSGYQRVLSGSSRGSDKIMELNIDALPKPTDPKPFIAEGIQQFKENIPIMRRGLPVLPGVTQPPQGNQSNGTPQTHIFSVGAWKRANPQGDANAAAKAAQAQGFQVMQ